ncbi:hypothetical protein [Domibacillus robiginosus]|uniref:hypothetical protein n=1 Tax=Domibacillus robiginosus TaxID=1071054 RepID=UPI00067A7FF7|nr:hypothetical protein [Domibacillus robiginosus]
MQVIFYNVSSSLINNFEKMPFAEAVKVSQEVEQICRDENKTLTGDFQVIGEDKKVFYRGVFNFGSYDYPNIYHKIKDMVKHIKVDKKDQADKIYLLEQIELLTPDQYKQAEMVDKTLINLDKSRVSKLKSWQRKTAYAAGGVSLAGFLMTGFLFFTQQTSYEKALDDGRNQLKESAALAETYGEALLGNDAKMVHALESSDELTEQQQQILVDKYVSENKFEKAVKLLDGDYVKAESLILTSSLPAKEKIAKIKAFHQMYPTNEARYDIAYLQGDYELMLNLKNINMSVKRSEMKTHALLKLGRVDEAKVELNNNSNEELNEKIVQYEIINAEIKTLKDKHELLVREEKDSEAEKLEKEIKTKQEQIKKL